MTATNRPSDSAPYVSDANALDAAERIIAYSGEKSDPWLCHDYRLALWAKRRIEASSPPEASFGYIWTKTCAYCGSIQGHYSDCKGKSNG